MNRRSFNKTLVAGAATALAPSAERDCRTCRHSIGTLDGHHVWCERQRSPGRSALLRHDRRQRFELGRSLIPNTDKSLRAVVRRRYRPTSAIRKSR
jgi:hypothetical protein